MSVRWQAIKKRKEKKEIGVEQNHHFISLHIKQWEPVCCRDLVENECSVVETRLS